MVLVTERDDVQEQKAMLEPEHADLEKRIKSVVTAIEAGGDAPSLIARLSELEARRNAIASDAAALRPVPRLPQSVIADRLADWRRMLRNPTQGRAVLQRLVKGRIVFTPTESALGGDIDRYTFEAPTRFHKLFSGVASPRPAFITPGGTAGRENIGPNEGFEDYGRLLERAFARVEASRPAVCPS